MENKDLKKRFEFLKIHFGVTSDILAEMGGLSTGTFYRMVKGDYSEKSLISFCQRLGVNYEWFQNDSSNMMLNDSPKPEIKTQSTNLVVQELIKEVNFMRELIQKLNKDLERKDEQLERKEKQLSMFIEKFVKAEVIDIEPRKTVNLEMYPKSTTRTIVMEIEEGKLKVVG